MKTIILSIAALLVVISCTKTITPKLNGATSQLVIQGIISDTAGPYHVSVVSTVDFYTANSYPGVSGASVIISDLSSGVKDSLTESSPGNYDTHLILQGIPGHVYELNVILGGNVYTSRSTMPMPVALDSTNFDVSDTTQINARANYQDPAGVHNFYKFAMVINGVVDKRFSTFDDRLSDGRYIREKVDADTGEIKRNYNVQLCLVGIDSGAFTYLHEAEDVAYNNAALAGPANPTSNISGGCLGYFSAQTVSSKTAVASW